MSLFRQCLASIDNCIRDTAISKEKIDDIILVGGPSKIPKIQEMIKDFFGGKELNIELNLDEAIAFGAAIQAAIMTNVNSREIEKFVLWEAIPFSLGVEIVGGVMTVLIPRNSTIACK